MKMRIRCISKQLVVGTLLALLLAACAFGPQTPGESGIDPPLETRLAEVETVQAYQATKIRGQEEILSYALTEVPQDLSSLKDKNAAQDVITSYILTRMPYPTPTAVGYGDPTTTPYLPLTGSVLIEEGRCCAGGLVGDVIEVQVRFEAFSQVGEVVEMRVMTGALDPQALAQRPWEPYVGDVGYPIEIQTANWVGWWVSVQYRDAAGNVSPVYSDDISIEGHESLPTPTP